MDAGGERVCTLKICLHVLSVDDLALQTTREIYNFNSQDETNFITGLENTTHPLTMETGNSH